MWRAFVDGVGSLFSSGRAAYGEASPYTRVRWAVLGVLGIDVIASVLFVALYSGRAIDADVWFEPGFPSNMVIVRVADGKELEDVTVILDGRYRLSVPKLKGGVIGFEVNHDFMDTAQLSPSDSYRPSTVELRADGDSMTIPLKEKGRK